MNTEASTQTTTYLVKVSIRAGGHCSYRVAATDKAEAMAVAAESIRVMIRDNHYGEGAKWAAMWNEGLARPVSARKAPRR